VGKSIPGSVQRTKKAKDFLSLLKRTPF